MGKYIIDIEEGKEGIVFCQTGIVVIGLHLNDEDSLKSLGIKSAIPYIEPSRGEIYKNAYQKGLSDAWDVARKIALSEADGGIQWKLKEQWFGKFTIYDIFKDVPAMEAIEKIRQYEQEQEEIKAGDEVQHRNHSGIKVIILNKDADVITAIAVTNVPFACKVGEMYINRDVKDWKKTGKHYDIAEVLRKIHEEEP